MWRLLIALGVGCLLLLIAVSNATAGTYVVRECSPATDHTPAPDAVYATNGSLAFTPDNNCGTGAGVAIGTQGSYGGPLSASWTFYAPVGAYFNSVNLQRHTNSGGTYNALVAVCGAAGCNSYSDNTTTFVPAQFGPAGWTSFVAMLQCGATCNYGGWVYVRNLEFTVLDPTNPVVKALGGSLVAGGTRHGTESLTIDATDQGGGVREVSVRVNGSEAVARPQNSCSIGPDGASGVLRPCGPAHYELSINTDSAPWVLGPNLMEICAYDLSTSGAPNAGCTQRTVEVDNTCQASGGAAPATVMDAGLQTPGGGELRSTAVVRSTQGATVRGRLASASGGVGDANVCMYETIADGSSTNRELTQIGKTKSDGTFAVQIPPGPSRKLDLVYRHNNKQVEKPNLLLDSVVVPTLQLQPRHLRNGRSVQFRGKIPGPNQANRAISLQALAGKKWRTFKNLRSDDQGRFKGIYRFTQTHGRAQYTFRALVKKQGGYPYEPGASRKRKVTVVG